MKPRNFPDRKAKRQADALYRAGRYEEATKEMISAATRPKDIGIRTLANRKAVFARKGK
jgi:hypothetical protein